MGGPVRLLSGRAAGLDLLVLDAPHLYARPGNPYLGPDGRDWPDNYRRYGLLSRVAADIGLGRIGDWRPDLVHGHDWQAGLAPAYLAFADAPRPATVLTIHNLAFQGLFDPACIGELGLPPEAFQRRRLRILGPGRLPQGRALLCRPAEHGEPDLRPGDPDRGPGHGPARPAAQPRRAIWSASPTASTTRSGTRRADPNLPAGYDAAAPQGRRQPRGRPGALPPRPRPRRAPVRRGQPPHGAERARPAAGVPCPPCSPMAASWPSWAPASRRWKRAGAPRRWPIPAGSAACSATTSRFAPAAGRRRRHPGAVALRALRPHPALRPALRHHPDRGPGRRAGRHGDRRQRGGAGRRRGHRHRVRAADRRGPERSRSPAPRRSGPIRRAGGGCRSGR